MPSRLPQSLRRIKGVSGERSTNQPVDCGNYIALPTHSSQGTWKINQHIILQNACYKISLDLGFSWISKAQHEPLKGTLRLAAIRHRWFPVLHQLD
jgi:hypothetical protein